MRFRDGRKGLRAGRCKTCKGRMMFQPRIALDMIETFVRIVPFHAQDDCRCYVVKRSRPSKRRQRKSRMVGKAGSGALTGHAHG